MKAIWKIRPEAKAPDGPPYPGTLEAMDGSGAASHSPQPVHSPARTRTSNASWLPSPISNTSGIDK